MNAKQIEAVLALEGPERVKHFARVVADEERVWSLYDDGWASSGTDDGRIALPLWPGREYAELCATDEWGTYAPQVIDLEDLCDALIPMLREQNALVAVFQTASGQGVTVAPDELLAILSNQLERY